MTRLTPDTAPACEAYLPVTPEQAAENRQVLRAALLEHDRSVRDFRGRRQSPPAAIAARRLIRAYADGNYPKANTILSLPRSGAAWRRLAEALAAAAADPGKLAPAPARQADELPFPPEAKDAAA